MGPHGASHLQRCATEQPGNLGAGRFLVGFVARLAVGDRVNLLHPPFPRLVGVAPAIEGGCQQTGSSADPVGWAYGTGM